MTLRDFEHTCRTMRDDAQATFQIDVFVVEPDSAEEIYETGIFCTIRSHYRTELYLRSDILDSEVTQIYARSLDHFCVVIDRKKEE